MKATFKTGCGHPVAHGDKLRLWFVINGRPTPIDGHVTKRGSFTAIRKVGAVSTGYLTREAARRAKAVVEVTA